MKNISNLTILGFAGAMFFAIITTARYYFQYQDIDKFIAYMTLAFLIGAVSFQWNQRLLDKKNYDEKLFNHQNRMEAVEDYIDDKREVLEGKKEIVVENKDGVIVEHAK